MKITLEEVARLTGGSLEGDGSTVVTGVAGIREAGPGDITFLANPKYIRDLAGTKAAAVIVPPGIDVDGPAVIRAGNAYLAFSRVLAHFAPRVETPEGVSAGAQVSPDAEVGPGVSIYPNVHVEAGARIGPGVTLYPGVYVGHGSSVGEGSTLYPNVVVRNGVRIGRNVTIHGGTVIGADGFGYATEGGVHHKVPQIGGVVVEDDVEIGANATIDRGTIGDTVIRRGAKIDNLVMVAHNVVVGEGSILVAQAGVSGSTELGRYVVLAGQVGVVGHIKLGDGVQVGAKSGVARDLEAGQAYSGIPAISHSVWLRVQAVLPRLPELKKTISELARRVEKLEKD